MNLVIELNEKNISKEIIPHFKLEEFICQDKSNILILNYALLYDLRLLRKLFKRSIIITSAYRTPEHNYKINGSEKSLHMRGLAVDLALPIIEEEKNYFIGLCSNIFHKYYVNESCKYIHCESQQLSFNHEDRN